MSKSATEQFQIKKKRKHPLSSGGATTNPPQLLNPSASKHFVSAATPKVIVKENYADFQVGDKHLTHSLHFKPLTTAEEAADIFIDSEYNIAATAAGLAHVAADSNCCANEKLPTAATTATVSAATATNCLRDKSQVLLLREYPVGRHNQINAAAINGKATTVIMPLQHGFYVKGALARKRALKSLKSTTQSPLSSLSAQPEEAKRTRRSLTNAGVVAENANIRSHTLLGGQATNNIQLSYLLGESLARHGRLQEAFDIYALISSEQLESFIPLEKLNILATALLEHIRILSSNSKKINETPNETGNMNSLGPLELVTASEHLNANSANTLASQWQLAVASLTAASAVALKTFTSDILNTSGEEKLDLHNPSRELTHSKSPPLNDEFDPLLCPLCRDILRCPVTANCGHTFCRQCCETITMCNICHIKFPRWQKDDMASNDMAVQKLDLITSLTTVTSTTASTSSATPTLPPYAANQQSSTLYAFPSLNSDVASISGTSELSRLRIHNSPSQSPLALSPTTVTTTSIACTTDTATTTMASTSALVSHSGGAGVGAGGGSSSADNMKFMPDVLVRRLVEKWWGSDLQAKKILETATSYMHLNLLDDALKFCNVSLEKCE